MRNYKSIDEEIECTLWNRLFHETLEILSREIRNDDTLNSGEKADKLLKLREGMLGSVGTALSYIKKTFLDVLYSKGILSRKKAKWNEISTSYNQVLADYEKFKEDPENNKELSASIKDRLNKLKAEVEEYKSMPDQSPVYNAPSKSPSSRKSRQKPEEVESRSSGGTESVGETTTAIDLLSTQVWRKYWKDQCGKFSGKELNRCKAKGVNVALRVIRSKLNKCQRTIDPEGCKQTLINLIRTWKKRKIDYMRSR